MTVGIAPDTFSEFPYLTVEEYKNAPTALDISNLVVGGNQTAQDQELARVILRASSYMDEYLNQNLVASQQTETQRVRVSPSGYLPVHPFTSPIIALISMEYGATPQNLLTLPDPSQCWFENQQILVPLYQNTWSSQGPLGFGFPPSNANQIFCKYTYVSGFVNTLASGTAGQSQLTVPDPTGIVAGQQYRIYDGEDSENVTVASNYTFGSTTVPISAPLASDHAAVAFGNMPNAIKQACILITSAFIKQRGDGSLTMMSTTRPAGQMQGSQLYGRDIALALDMVDKYRRIR